MLAWSYIKRLFTWLLFTHALKNSFCTDQGKNQTRTTNTDSKQSNDSSSNLGKKKTSVLDIRKSDSTSEYDYFKNDTSKCSLYISKPDYLFNCVKQSKSSKNLIYSKDFNIWKSKDETEYAYLIMIDGVGSSFKKLQIHLVDGTIKSFYKPKKDHYWTTQSWSSGLLIGTDPLSRSSEHQPDEIKIITQDGSGFHENDTTKYDVVVKKTALFGTLCGGGGYRFDFFMYCLKDKIKCTEVKYNDEVVWRHNQKSNKFPQTIAYFQNNKEIKVYFDYSSSLEYKLEGGKWNKINKTKTIELNINSLNDADDDTYKFYKNDSTKTYVYVSRCSMFNKVKQDDKMIYESQNPNEHVHLVIVKDINTNEQKVTTYLTNGEIKVFKLGSNSKFIESDLKQETSLYFAKRIKISESETKNDKDNKEQESDDLTQKNFCSSHITILTQGDNKSKPSENDTTKYDVYDSDTKVEYEFKDNVKCVGVKYDDHLIWTYDKNETNQPYPTSVLLYLLTNTVIITFKEEDILYAFKLTGSEWKTLVKGKVTLSQLDVGKKESTAESNYTGNDNIGTFEVNEGNLFKEVIKKKGCCQCGSDFIFLQAKEPGQYCYKVVRDGIGSTKCMENVTLYLVNGQVKKYKNVGSFYNVKWKDIQPVGPDELKEQWLKKIDVKEHPTEIKLISKYQQSSNRIGQSGTEGTPTSAEASTTNNPESDTTKYVVKKSFEGIFNYELNGFNCKEVKYNDEVVWTTGDLSKDCPLTIHFIQLAKVLVFTFPDDSYYLYRGFKSGDNFEWECFSLQKMTGDLKSILVVEQTDKSKDGSNYGVKYYGFGLEVKFSEGFECLKLSYDYNRNGYHTFPFWSHSPDKYKGVYPIAAYCFKGENFLILFEKNFAFYINDKWKVDPKAKSSVYDGQTTPSTQTTPSNQCPEGTPTSPDGSTTNNPESGVGTDSKPTPTK